MILAHNIEGRGPERVLMLHDWLGDSSTYDAAMPYFDPSALSCARVDLRRRDALASQSGGRLSPRWLEWKLERWAACSDPTAVAAYVDLFARPDLATTRADTSVPVLAITGAEDAPPFQREAVEPALAAVFPGVLAEVCASAGHYPMQETPPLFASRVERFIRANPIESR